FRYAGMAIANGQTPYLDFFDHKPPLVYFVYRLAHPLGVHGVQVVFTLLTFLVAIPVYQCCRYWLGRWGVLFTVLWIAMMHDPLVMADGGQNRQLSALFTSALLAYGFRKQERPNGWLLGVGASLVFFTQVTDTPALLPFFAWLLFKPGGANRKRVLQCIAGFLVPAIVIISWLYVRGAHHAFFYSAFTFNSSWYIDSSYFAAKTKYVAVLLVKTGYIVPLAAQCLLWRSAFRKQAVVILLCGVVQAVLLVPGFFFNHYFIAVIPYAFFGWLLLATGFIQQPNNKFSQWVYGIPVLVGLLIVFHIKPLHWLNRTPNSFEKRMVEKMEPYAREVQGRAGQLYSFDQPPFLSLNATYNITSPSRWLYLHFWLRPGWDTRLDTFKTEVLQQLDKYQCTYIMDRDNGVLYYHPALKELWTHYINREYALIFEEKSATGKTLFRLLKRKPKPGANVE
ncbi:MAG: hypothetical protein JNM68_02960, partial [Dinghuibacter sp.]|nr:hypothetical protein [Dinghuibacter sp.]